MKWHKETPTWWLAIHRPEDLPSPVPEHCPHCNMPVDDHEDAWALMDDGMNEPSWECKRILSKEHVNPLDEAAL